MELRSKDRSSDERVAVFGSRLGTLIVVGLKCTPYPCDWRLHLKTKIKFAVGILIVLALVLLPAPLLPPHQLVEAIQHALGVAWEMAYLGAAIGLQVAFYFTLGVLAATTVKRAPTIHGRLLQIGVLPIVVVGLAFSIRSLKAGHLPHWINTVTPIGACLFGVTLGLGLLYRHFKMTAIVSVTVLAAVLWVLLGGASPSLRAATEAHLQRLVAAGPGLPAGEARFGALLQTAFAPLPDGRINETEVQHNRGAILAFGIAVGHPRLARLVGLDPHTELIQRAAALSQGTTLRGREDWPRHYALSAGLAVLEHPLISDAGGLMKEQLDALTGGSGFSFGDLTADRAGIRFATAATSGERAAKAMQVRIQHGYSTDDFFPRTVDFPENLTVEQFRRDFGGVGTPRYRLELNKIERLLDSCVALSNSQLEE